MVEKVKDILKKKNTKKSINIDKIQKNKIKIFEELFDNQYSYEYFLFTLYLQTFM